MKSLINQQFVAINAEQGEAVASGHHPVLYVSQIQMRNLFKNYFRIIKVKDMDRTKAEELIIQKFDDRESREPVMFG